MTGPGHVPRIASLVSGNTPGKDTHQSGGGLPAAESEEDPILLGMMAGPWRPAFENWIEMAKRHGHRYRIIGREIRDFVPFITKLQCLLACLRSLPCSQIVFYLDASDGFVCSDPQNVLKRYRFYETPVVLGAERGPYPTHAFAVPDPAWRWANSGAFVAEAGVMADALQSGYGLEDWERFGHVSDQHAVNLHFHLPEHRDKATVDFRRLLVANIGTLPGLQDQLGHMLTHLPVAEHWRLVSSLHFFGGNRSGYNAFASSYGLRTI